MKIQTSFSLTWPSIVLIVLGASFLNATEYTVAPGDDLQAAIDGLQAGDTLWFEDGTFYIDILEIKNKNSTENHRIRLKAVNPGQASLRCVWEKADNGTLSWTSFGSGVWKADEQWSYTPYLGVYDGKPLHRLTSVQELQTLKITAPAGSGFYSEPTEIDIPPYGYAVENGYVHVRLPGDVDPNGESVTLGAQRGELDLFGTEINVPGCIYVINSPGITFDGFHIIGGMKAIDFDDASTHGMVRNCLFESTGFGVDMSDYTIVEWCEYFQRGLLDYVIEHFALNGENSYWPMVKVYPASGQGSPRTRGLVISYRERNDESIKHCESRYNYIYEVFEGEKVGLMEYSSTHHNVYEHVFDNACELETVNGENTFGRELRFHHNLIIGRQKGALAFQIQNNTPMTGPIYIYNNVFDIEWDNVPGENKTRFNNFLKCQNPSVTAYVYHNLFREDTQRGILRNSILQDFVGFQNNIVIISSGQTITGGSIDNYWPDQDYNLFVRGAPVLSANDLYVNGDADVQFTDLAGKDFSLTAASPAVDAGEVLSLPGIQTNVSDGNPDIGPFELGEPMPADWPRPRTRTFKPENENTVLLDNGTLSSYSDQDISGNATFLESGNALNLTGNNWKKISYPCEVTSDTVLEFVLNASDTGEITGIGFDEDNDHFNAPRIFQLSGSDDWSNGISVSPSYLEGEGQVSYSIPVGSHYTGSMQYLVFTANDDHNASCDVTFSNLVVHSTSANGGGEETELGHGDLTLDADGTKYYWYPENTLDDSPSTYWGCKFGQDWISFTTDETRNVKAINIIDGNGVAKPFLIEALNSDGTWQLVGSACTTGTSDWIRYDFPSVSTTAVRITPDAPDTEQVWFKLAEFRIIAEAPSETFLGQGDLTLDASGTKFKWHPENTLDDSPSTYWGCKFGQDWISFTAGSQHTVSSLHMVDGNDTPKGFTVEALQAGGTWQLIGTGTTTGTSEWVHYTLDPVDTTAIRISPDVPDTEQVWFKLAEFRMGVLN